MFTLRRPYQFAFIDAVGNHFQRAGISFDRVEIERNMSLDREVSRQTRLLTSSQLQPFAEMYVGECAARGPIEHSCHAISHGFALTLQQTSLGEQLPVAITIGNVWYKGKNIYQVTRDKIDAVIREGFDASQTVDVHVWLTLSDMTVVDLSILSTIQSLGLAPSASVGGNRVLFWREEVPNDFEFEPLLVDNDFFLKVERGLVVRGGA